MIAKNLQDLVVLELPKGATDQQIQRFVQYFMRILSSRIQSVNGSGDADRIKTLLTTKGK